MAVILVVGMTCNRWCNSQSSSKKLVRSMLCYCNGNGHGSKQKLQGDSVFLGKTSFHPWNSPSVHRNVRDVRWWHNETAASQKIVQIHDDHTDWPGTSSMSSLDVSTTQVEELIFEKWRVTLRDLSAVLEFCTRSVHNTATKNYDTTRCAHQVPRCLVEEHKYQRFEIAFTLKRKAMSSWKE